MTRLVCTLQGHPVTEHEDGSVSYTSRARIDADGEGGNPYRDPYYQPSTSLKHPNGKSLSALTERYVVVPPEIVAGVVGVVLGCQALATYRGRSEQAVVGDIGPPGKLGEISVALATALGMDPSPINGGVDAAVVGYVLWPGVAAVVDGVEYVLRPS